MSLGKAEKRYLDIPASWISRPWENALQFSSFGWVRTCLRKTTFFWQQVFANFRFLYTKVDISTSKNMCNPEFSHDIQMLFNYIYYSFPPTILLWPKVFLWYSDAFSMIFLMFFSFNFPPPSTCATQSISMIFKCLFNDISNIFSLNLQVHMRPRVFPTNLVGDSGPSFNLWKRFVGN